MTLQGYFIGIFGGGILGGGVKFKQIQTKQAHEGGVSLLLLPVVNIIKCIDTNPINLTNQRLGQGFFEYTSSQEVDNKNLS